MKNKNITTALIGLTILFVIGAFVVTAKISVDLKKNDTNITIKNVSFENEGKLLFEVDNQSNKNISVECPYVLVEADVEHVEDTDFAQTITKLSKEKCSVLLYDEYENKPQKVLAEIIIKDDVGNTIKTEKISLK